MKRPLTTLAKVLVLGMALFTSSRLIAAPELGPWIPMFKGIDHIRATNKVTGGDFQTLMVANALRIDLQDPDIKLLSTPRHPNYLANVRETAGMTVSRFLKLQGVQVAINANFFNPQDYYLPEGSSMAVTGLAISDGVQVSPATGSYSASLLVDAANHAQLIPTNWPPVNADGIYTAVTGDYPLVIAGVNIGRRYLGNSNNVHDRNPRTAVGLSQDRRYLYLLVIDGRQGGYSNGAYDYETAAWFLLLGAYDANNLDGGGSSTMVAQDSLGNPVELNHSSAVADSGKERTVGSHLGVFAKPLPGFINDVAVAADDEIATVTWTTTSPATTQVEYGRAADFGDATVLQTDNVTNHFAQLTGLTPGTDYYFRAVSMVGTTRYASSNLLFTTSNHVTTNEVVALTGDWRFTSANLDGIAWTAPDYDDSGWGGPGAGLLWTDVRSTGPNPSVGPRGAEMPADAGTGFPYLTYYLRTHFEVPSTAPGASLLFSGYIDDGAVLYLNGHEIYRLRMDAAPAAISNDTLATGFPCAGDADCLDEFAVTDALAQYMVAGDNVLAAEVHNYNPRSADITFGLSVIDAQHVTAVPVLGITNAGGQATLNWTSNGFTLQQADSPAGPWSDVPGPVVTGPFTPSDVDGAPERYYRLRQ